MWNWTLAVKLLSVGDSDSFSGGNRSTEGLLPETGDGVVDLGLRGKAGTLAPWMTISLVATTDDTANRNAIAIGALEDSISIETSADSLRIVALGLGLGVSFQGSCSLVDFTMLKSE